MYLTTKFDRPMFSRSEVIVRTNILTNKQTPLKTSTSLRYATPVDNDFDVVINKAPFTRYNLLSHRLSKRFDNRFDKRLYRVYNRLSNRLYNPV